MGFVSFVASETATKVNDIEGMALNIAITSVFIAILVMLFLLCNPITCRKCWRTGLAKPTEIAKPQAFVVCPPVYDFN